MNTARVLNIERYSTEDGPGIRTTVFLKGCALRCKWCSNPESQSFHQEILLNPVRCIGCGRCEKLCNYDAITYSESFGMVTDSAKCSLCLDCIDNCYADARSLQGKDMVPADLMGILNRDAEYYTRSGGGITFSGGEPVFYADFIEECTKEIHKRGWSVLIETCGHVDPEKMKTVSSCADIIYYDFKQCDPVRHKLCTGEDNHMILENLRWLDKNFKGEICLRYPYIPGWNDAKEDIEGFLRFAQGLEAVRNIVFLPFHRLGLDKYQGLGRHYELGNMESLKVKDILFLKEYESVFDLKIEVQ